jgi:hypothetical protein
MSTLHARNEHQQALLHSRDDVRSLTNAFTTFTALQHVQLNPVLDTAMVHLLNFLESRETRGEGLGHMVQLKWEPACRHGLYSLGQALAGSRSKCNKISIPAMDQESALSLCSGPVPPLSTFAHNLTSLILQFVTADVERLSQLAPYFQRFLSRTVNLEAIHIGFPMAQPLDVRLEDVFHDIKWPKLRALGIQAWRLKPEEIIDIARRHRKSLRGLRLREVLLKEGQWSDVLQMLRSEMQVLDWVSLRRIDYASHFENLQAGQGFEIGDEDDEPDHQAFGMMNIDASSSDGDGDEEGEDQADDEVVAVTGVDAESGDDSTASNEGSDHNPIADQLDLPLSSDAAAARPLEQSSTSATELGDNGIAVAGRQTTKAWEAWVTARTTN